MERFAAATPPLGGKLGWPSLPWLAGLLEAEGTFLAPPPSSPNTPIISCRMTDRDVIERVAFIFGRSIQSFERDPHKTEYATTIKGSPAVHLMRILRPLMGSRRQAAIDRAIGAYIPRKTKLGPEIAEMVRRRIANGERMSALAREFDVSHHTVRSVVAGRIYRPPRLDVWLQLSRLIGSACAAGTGLTWSELYWLAGWLEGEGSFLAPPPSRRTSPRIIGQATDKSVVQEVGRLLRVKAQFTHSSRDFERGWAPTWRVSKQGREAIILMEAMAPAMGIRRRTQIETAVGLAMEAARFERASSVTNDRLLQV